MTDDAQPDRTQPWWRFPLIDASGKEVGHVDRCGAYYDDARMQAAQSLAGLGVTALAIGTGRKIMPDGDSIN